MKIIDRSTQPQHNNRKKTFTKKTVHFLNINKNHFKFIQCLRVDWLINCKTDTNNKLKIYKCFHQ